MQFCYILSGWEGSATDGRIFDDARQKDFAIPSGSYYLADAGFMTCNALLIPYCGTRYHLKEWGRAPQKYCFFSLKFSPLTFHLIGHAITRSFITSDTHKLATPLNTYLVL